MGGSSRLKKDENLFRRCQTYIVPYEGFPTYGGLSGRDMEALAQGLMESLRYEIFNTSN